MFYRFTVVTIFLMLCIHVYIEMAKVATLYFWEVWFHTHLLFILIFFHKD